MGKKCNTVNIGHLTPSDPPTAQRALSLTFSGRLCQPILLIRPAHKKGDKGIKCSGRSRTKREEALTSVTTSPLNHLSPVSLTLVLGNQSRAWQSVSELHFAVTALTGQGSQSTRCKPICSSLLLCTAGATLCSTNSSALCAASSAAGPCSLRWRVRECSSALLDSSRAKVQAATNTFQFFTSDLAGGRG